MKYIILFYQWIIAGPILLLYTIITSIVTVLGVFMGSRKIAPYYPSKYWGKLFCVLMFVRVEVIGKEKINKNTSYVFVANHQGAYDIFAIYGYLNHQFRWVMKKSLEKIPFVGLACKKSNHIFVDRKSANSIKQTMKRAKGILKDGMSLVIFPEGSRSNNGKMRPFKRGAFKLATDLHLPVVPITVNGSYDVLPKTTYNIKPGKITLIIHDPIFEYDNSILDVSYDIIQSSLDEKYKK